MIAALACLVVAVEIYALLFFLGWPTWLLIGRNTGALSLALAAPLFGLAVLQLFSWYWLDHAQGGMKRGLPILLAANAAFAVAMIVRRRQTFQWPRKFVVTLGVDVSLGLSVFAVFAFAYREVFRAGRLTSGSLFVADMAHYAAEARHLHSASFHHAGNAVGMDLGGFAARGTPGTFSVLSTAISWTGRPVWEVSLPVMFILMLFIALAARDLSSLLGGSQHQSAFIGLLAASSPFVVYVMANYFLAQFIAMPIMFALLLVVYRASLQEERGLQAQLVVQVALLTLAIILTYPVQAYLAAALIVAIVLAASLGCGWQRRYVRVAMVAGVGFTLAILVIPTAARRGVTYARGISTVTAGYRLPGLTPARLLGISTVGPVPMCMMCEPPRGPRPQRFLLPFCGEAAMVLGLGTLAAQALPARRRRTGFFLLVATSAVLSSYALVWKTRGYSYQQWKWISFYQPVFVAAFLSLLAAIVCPAAARRLGTARLRRITAGGTAFVVFLVVLGRVRPLTAPTPLADPTGALQAQPMPWALVDANMIALHADKQLAPIKSLNVNLQQWEEMWTVSVLAPRRLYLQVPNYFPVAAPRAEWTLEYAVVPNPRPPGSAVTVLNDRFRLVREVTTGIPIGTPWVQGDCAGFYRFDGARWQAVERTEGGGQFDLEMRAAAAPAPGTAETILARREPISNQFEGDFLLLQHLGSNLARFVYEQASGTPARVVNGQTFELVPGQPYQISAVFDPFLGEVLVAVDGQPVLETSQQFFRPYDAGGTVVGKGASVIASDFAGSVTILPRRTPQCRAFRRSVGPSG